MGTIIDKILISRLRKESKRGNPVAQRRLGHIYYGYKGFQNLQKAVELYRLAAEQGDAIAQRQLGICYYNGSGVNKDNKEATRWIALAAKHGDAQAALDYATLCATSKIDP